MAKSQPTPEPPVEGGYFYWSRDPAVGLFAVLPLWGLYELLRMSLSPDERNGAEFLLVEGLAGQWPTGLTVLRVVLLFVVAAGAVSILRRDVPWAKVALVSALEGSVYGLLLGPLAMAMANSSIGFLDLTGSSTMAADLVGALGAGIFEELVFRLGLMSALVWMFTRITRACRVPDWSALAGAVLVSALVFSWFHHVPPGNPFEMGVFVFRTMAGILLGVLFALRGFGVVVYCHAIYDVHFYLVQ